MTAWARGTAGNKFGHLKKYASQKKISIDEAYAKFGYEQPQIPDGFRHVWQWFFELAQTRTQNGFGWNPLGWAEMEAWSRITGVDLQPWLAACFMRMDQAWLAVVREQADGRRDRDQTQDRSRGRRRGRS